MKVLMINGSPHEKGCTYTALCEIKKVLEKEGIESEILYLGTSAINGCIACGYCVKNGKCVFDDLVNKVNSRLDEFNGLIIGSPVYYAGPSGALTAFLDRLFYSSRGRMAGKLGAAVMSCRRGGATATFDRLNKYFTIANMPVVSSQYWNQVHGNSPSEVLQDEEGLQTMRTLAQNMAWLLKCIEEGRKHGINKPQYEPKINTNFIR